VTDVDHVDDASSSMSAKEAVHKIGLGVQQLDGELSKQVVAHHEELLHQVADVRELERVLERVRDGVHALEDGMDALQMSVREPYAQLSASVGDLERVQAVTDLLRRTSRYLTLAARLRDLLQRKVW
jgi:conserved oligomeric Golgi complex subunit 5